LAESVTEKTSVKKGDYVLYKGNGSKWVKSEVMQVISSKRKLHIEWNDEYIEVDAKDVKPVKESVNEAKGFSFPDSFEIKKTINYTSWGVDSDKLFKGTYVKDKILTDEAKGEGVYVNHKAKAEVTLDKNDFTNFERLGNTVQVNESVTESKNTKELTKIFNKEFEDFPFDYKEEGSKIIIDPNGYNPDGTLFSMKDDWKEDIMRVIQKKKKNWHIAPNMGGTKEQLENFNPKLLFDISSFKSFFKALEYALNNHKGVSKNARKFVKENYSADLMCKNTLKIYQNLIN